MRIALWPASWSFVSRMRSLSMAARSSWWVRLSSSTTRRRSGQKQSTSKPSTSTLSCGAGADLSASVQEVAFELGASRRWRCELAQHCAERPHSSSPTATLHGLLDLAEIEQAPPLRLLDRALQLPRPGDLGEVEERAGERADGDAVDEGHIIRMELPHAVESDAVARAPAPLRDGHLDPRARARPELMQRDRRPVAEHGPRPVRQHRGHAAPVPGERGVPDGIYAERHTVELPLRNRCWIAARPKPSAMSCQCATTPRWRVASSAISRSPGLHDGRISPTMRPTSVMGATLAVPQTQRGYERNDRVSGGGRFCPGVRGTTFRCLLRVFLSESDLGVRVGRSEGYVTGAIPS